MQRRFFDGGTGRRQMHILNGDTIGTKSYDLSGKNSIKRLCGRNY